jgi:hypothetical protein
LRFQHDSAGKGEREGGERRGERKRRLHLHAPNKRREKQRKTFLILLGRISDILALSSSFFLPCNPWISLYLDRYLYNFQGCENRKTLTTKGGKSSGILVSP